MDLTPITITGTSVVSGHGEGRRIGVPTINLEPSCVPESISHGVYACRITFDGATYDGALHFGPRPAFNDSTVSCEIHVLDTVIKKNPETVDLKLYNKIRDIQNFDGKGELTEEIQRDIQKIRAILGVS